MSDTDQSVPPPPAALSDRHGRRVEYLRLSLTDRCPFRCLYCMPPEGQPSIPHAEILSYEEFLRLCRIAVSLGMDRYKITGGEPLCRKGATGFIRELKKIPGVASVTITTNGLLLARALPELADAGIDAVTVSLDAFTQDTLERVTRSDTRLETILEAMDRTREAGIRVKINTVPVRGVNEDELLPLARYALEKGYQIRFIELMPVGKGKSWSGVPRAEVQAALAQAFGPLAPLNERTGNGPAECLSVAGYPGSVGFIAALSHAFCGRCNRIRLTSTGFLKTCLHHGHGVDLRAILRDGAPDGILALAIRRAVAAKPKGHDFRAQAASDAETPFLMSSIGG